MEKEYCVTLYDRDRLEDFYDEMKSKGFKLSRKRPISRNTHYWMTEEQAVELRKDSSVWGVDAVDDFHDQLYGIYNNTSYNKNGNYWKDDSQPPLTVYSGDYQWGHIHCAGAAHRRGKGYFGDISAGGTYERRTNQPVSIFNDGKHTDVVIVDDPMAYDSEEWYSPTANSTRFVQYQWFNELSSIVSSIDDNYGGSEPTGTITYAQNSNLSYYHGQHVGGIVAGQHYGWATEANIYNMHRTGTYWVHPLLRFDYLRAFHLNKAVNSTTGRRNPTITNHSYGGLIYYNTDETSSLAFSDIGSIRYRNTTYNSSNPGPSGWSQTGVGKDFGIRFDSPNLPSYNSGMSADVQDAIADGIVVIAAAGNDNMYIAEPNDADWNNYMVWSKGGSWVAAYMNRGAWPASPDGGAIVVGALSNIHDFRRADFTNYGPSIDTFAPGQEILSCFGNTGLADGKYGSGNYFYPIGGTSMSSPQVAGVAAILATAKPRFGNEDVRSYLQQTNINDDMTFDSGTGTHDDDTCQIGSPNSYLHSKNPRAESGMIDNVKGERKTSGTTFPRKSTFNYTS